MNPCVISMLYCSMFYKLQISQKSVIKDEIGVTICVQCYMHAHSLTNETPRSYKSVIKGWGICRNFFAYACYNDH